MLYRQWNYLHCIDIYPVSYTHLYAIGVAKPVSVYVETFGTGKVSEEKLIQLIDKYFDLRPAAIIQKLNLRTPIYEQVAAYGHFGRDDLDIPWEKLDMVDVLKKEL